MKPLCLSFIAIFSVYCSNAQKFIGIRGGLSIPNLYAVTNNEISRDYKSVLSSNAGFLYEAPIMGSDKWAIMLELDYLGVGGVRKGMQPVVSKEPAIQTLYEQLTAAGVYKGGYLYADYKNESVFGYLSIPVLVKRYFGEGIRLYLEGGMSANILLTAQNTTSGSSRIFYNNNPLQAVTPGGLVPLPAQSFDQTRSIKNDIHTMNFNVIVGAGLMFPVNKNYFFVDGRFDYGILALQKDKVNGVSNAAAGIISVGYAVSL
ncbi:MAG: hypothetical protein CRN43_07510 [Candidatus Nephrothrix sp. EaCA]|nr:MAG: hypothetical protein CRN43_07510 [Candidatus Nephrothrix sp. EaCA]